MLTPETHPNMVFVFGSNRQGIHGAGAALDALRFWGAKPGIGEGFCGNSYAIPTKKTPYITLPLTEIYLGVVAFEKFAKQHPEYEFLVTRFGCQRAGYKDSQIASLFYCVTGNMIMPIQWQTHLQDYFDVQRWHNEGILL